MPVKARAARPKPPPRAKRVAQIAAPAALNDDVAPGAATRAETAAIVAGLLAPTAEVSPKYFYDALGSHLFEAITELPEYYPTRTEQSIFTTHATAIAAAAGPGSTLIDLGAGNCEKAASLFGALRPARYVAIDISAAFLAQALRDLRRLHPEIPMQGLALDFSAGLSLPATVGQDKRLFFYPGSSLGNFTPPDALRLLQDVRAHCGRDGALLIGIDLVKDEAVLNAAYDDELGVTAAFNLNLLRHLNTLIGSDFKVREWRHEAFYNATRSRIEMHLAARRDLVVNWPGGSRRFAEGQRIHTENSYKYRLGEFDRLLKTAGFAGTTIWTDDNAWFALCLASVAEVRR